MNLDDFEKELLKNKKYKKLVSKIDIPYEIGMKIFEERIRHGMTQIKLAKKIGTKQSGIARAENGKSISLPLLEKIARALNVDLRELIPSTRETRSEQKFKINVTNQKTDLSSTADIELLNIKREPLADIDRGSYLYENSAPFTIQKIENV